MASVFEILMMLLGVVKFIIIVQVIMSWLIAFQVLNARQALVGQIWDALTRMTEPLYRPVRGVLPDMGGLDLAPLVVFLCILALEIILNNNAGFFY